MTKRDRTGRDRIGRDRIGRDRIGRDLTRRDRGSATVWVLTTCALVVLAGSAAMLRTEAVLARHRAESAADLVALAAAGRIGIGTDVCAAARRIAAADAVVLDRCATDLDADGRSGTVSVRVRATVRLPVVGRRIVTATARAGRLKAGVAAPDPGG